MCTAIRFTDENGALFFGRNLDWMESYGEEILATPRGFAYDYALGATHAEQPHAVLGVGCVMGGKPMYFDCANDAGLAIAGLNFPRCGAFPHEPAEGKCNVATFEFPLWVARNFASTDEAEHALTNTQIVSLVQPGQPESLLHWIIADGTRTARLRKPRQRAGQFARAAVAYRQSRQLSAHKQRRPATDRMGHAGVARMGYRGRHAGYSWRPLLAFALRARGLRQCPPPRQDDGARKHSAPLPYACGRPSDGRHGEVGRRTFRENHFHQRILQRNEHLLREHLRRFRNTRLPVRELQYGRRKAADKHAIPKYGGILLRWRARNGYPARELGFVIDFCTKRINGLQQTRIAFDNNPHYLLFCVLNYHPITPSAAAIKVDRYVSCILRVS